MTYIRNFLLVFWLTVYALGWFWVKQYTDPLSYGIMVIVLIALLVAWIELGIETRRIWTEELE